MIETRKYPVNFCCFLDDTFLPHYLPLHSFEVVDPMPGVVVAEMHLKHPFCPSLS